MRLRLPLHGVKDLHRVDDPLEHLGEGPLDEAFQSLLKALQHAHSRPFRSRLCRSRVLVGVPHRYLGLPNCGLVLTRPPRFFEDMMVSGPTHSRPRTDRPGMLLFAGASHGAYEPGGIRLAPAGSRSILVHATGSSNACSAV